MTPGQLEVFVEENKKSTAEAIRITVNGKIESLRAELHDRSDQIKSDLDMHNSRHENDMKRILPVILAYEASQRFAGDAKASGKFIIWMAGFITSVGAAYLLIRNIFNL